MSTRVLYYENTTKFNEGIQEHAAAGWRLREWQNVPTGDGGIRAIFSDDKTGGTMGSTMLADLKGAVQKYLQDNRDLIFTVLLLFIVDAYFLNGALRSRLEATLHKTVDRLEGKTADVVKT